MDTYRVQGSSRKAAPADAVDARRTLLSLGRMTGSIVASYCLASRHVWLYGGCQRIEALRQNTRQTRRAKKTRQWILSGLINYFCNGSHVCEPTYFIDVWLRSSFIFELRNFDYKEENVTDVHVVHIHILCPRGAICAYMPTWAVRILILCRGSEGLNMG